jgi:hypothetical protein
MDEALGADRIDRVADPHDVGTKVDREGVKENQEDRQREAAMNMAAIRDSGRITGNSSISIFIAV